MVLADAETAHLEEEALIFQSRQYVEIDIYKNRDHSLRREAVYKTTSEDFLVGVLLESGTSCFLGSLCPIPWRDSFRWQCSYYSPTGSSRCSVAHSFAQVPVYMFRAIRYEAKQLWCLQALRGSLLQMGPAGELFTPLHGLSLSCYGRWWLISSPRPPSVGKAEPDVLPFMYRRFC